MSLYQTADGVIHRYTSMLFPVELLHKSKELGLNRTAVCQAALREAIERRIAEDKVRALQIAVQKAPTTPYTEAQNGSPDNS